jgi:NADP-dependent aldehyde dehydrogenase
MSLRSINPKTGEVGGTVAEAIPVDVARAAVRAAGAFPAWRTIEFGVRGRVLREMADGLDARRARLVDIADFESGLGTPRLDGELTRTTDQLRAFAAAVEDGSFVEAILSPGDPNAMPAPRPDVRRCLVPIGPVGVFTPSNFPLAFGVAGGDTASALAAGCTVVVKGHPSHPATSELCFETLAQAVTAAGAPAGLVSLVQGSAPELSRTLVQAPEVQAIAFTGSPAVGRLLFDLAAARPHPIPFYGELGSLNPVFIGPDAAGARGVEIAHGLAASITLGHGQFCTKPGLVFVPEGDAGDIVVAALSESLSRHAVGAMLNAALRAALDRRVHVTGRVPGVEELTHPPAVPEDGCHAAPRLFVTDLDTFQRRPELAEEHFGPVAIVVRIDPTRALMAAERLTGQLTGTVHADAADAAWARPLVDAQTLRVGRVIWNGYPTGVTVVPGMHHGGPYPASTSSLHTSVGAAAIRRFLRPVAFQAVPDALLPPALQNGNPLGIQRFIGGEWTRRPV